MREAEVMACAICRAAVLYIFAALEDHLLVFEPYFT